MLLRAFRFLRLAQQQAILDSVMGQPAAKCSHAMGILLGVSALLEHFEPDPPSTHPLQSQKILEWNRKVPSPFGILRGKTAADKDGR
jgi:hypothetical protein